jgi:hypothetical protein
MQLTKLMQVVALAGALPLAACSSPQARFINSYKEVWRMENKVGQE